ncbi:hypothetical protein HDU82_008210 [Entophlyctis luteolus]|nr:hypothetical protein HDU82_008210 [Entophlyctis luteolus]
MSSSSVGVGLFNFKAQYVRYAEYHSNKTNQRIHTVFVPTILFTSLIIAGYFDTRVMYAGAAAYSLYYLALHPIIGGSASLIVAGLTAAAAAFLKHGKDWTGYDPLYPALGVFVVAWIAQFIGHGVYERRSPALLDNLDLNQELKNETGKRVAEFRAKQAAAAKAKTQ